MLGPRRKPKRSRAHRFDVCFSVPEDPAQARPRFHRLALSSSEDSADDAYNGSIVAPDQRNLSRLHVSIIRRCNFKRRRRLLS